MKQILACVVAGMMLAANTVIAKETERYQEIAQDGQLIYYLDRDAISWYGDSIAPYRAKARLVYAIVDDDNRKWHFGNSYDMYLRFGEGGNNTKVMLVDEFSHKTQKLTLYATNADPYTEIINEMAAIIWKENCGRKLQLVKTLTGYKHVVR